MPLDLATVLRRVLTVDALMHVDLFKVKLLPVVEDGARIIREEAAPFARVLPLVVVIRVDDGRAIALAQRRVAHIELSGRLSDRRHRRSRRLLERCGQTLGQQRIIGHVSGACRIQIVVVNRLLLPQVVLAVNQHSMLTCLFIGGPRL